MRENGSLGLMRVIFECVRDGFSTARAWQVMAVFALIAILPIALIAGLIWLVIALI
jgi:hypothetical protein